MKFSSEICLESVGKKEHLFPLELLRGWTVSLGLLLEATLSRNETRDHRAQPTKREGLLTEKANRTYS